jgi:gas vesicle protein
MLAAGACAIGALAFMFFAGASGQRRRELVRDKALQAGETISKGGREVVQRIESVAMEAAKRVRGQRSEGLANGVSDQRMGERSLHA